MAENTIPMTLDGQAYEKKKASQIIARLALIQSGGHGARTRNPLRGTTFPVWPLTIRLPSVCRRGPGWGHVAGRDVQCTVHRNGEKSRLESEVR